MTKIRRSLLKDVVAVETYAGEGAYGPLYAAAVDVKCNVDQTRRLVRTAAGDEAVSALTLQVHPSDAARFTPESRLAFAAIRSRVLAARERSFRGAVAFVEVTCA